MNQRIAKVESLVQQVVARAVPELYPEAAAQLTVTRVDVSPDLHNATVWFGMLGEPAQQEVMLTGLQQRQGEIQERLAGTMATKYVPRLHFRQDTGGEYAANIERILKDL
ncbi:MAG TPA: 30S ribosome-binding factor RbfA [Candidatus Saccharimonas sp.]|nr:30S ribosome-binding factor RbfA [Candidatus Saccharimonas sp.]